MKDQQNSKFLDSAEREAFARLIEAISERGDRNAFRVIYDYYAPRLKGFVLRMGADDATAEEIVQDVMMTVWRKASTFDRTQASVSTWLFRIARNRRIDFARRAAKPDLDLAEPMLAPSAEPYPDDALSASERETHVRRAVENLPEEQASVLRMAFFDAKSHREIADEIGLPLGTVKSRIRLAFARLKNALDTLA